MIYVSKYIFKYNYQLPEKIYNNYNYMIEMGNKKIIKLPEELTDRIDKFINQKGRSIGLENRTELTKRAIDEFLSKYEN